MTFADVSLYLGVTKVCPGGCGLSATRHKNGAIDPFSVIHWRPRRMSRRALRRFLLLVVRRNRLNEPAFLNIPKYDWLYLYLDNIGAGRLAGHLGMRLPAALSRNDRLTCLTLARKAGVRLSSQSPHVYSWAKRGMEL